MLIGLTLAYITLTIVLVTAQVVQAKAVKEADLLKMQGTINNLWVFWTTLSVGGLNLGFGLREMGLCSPKNAVNALSKTILVMGLVGLAYWAMGFSLMFAKSDNQLIGVRGWFFASESMTALGLKDWPIGLPINLFLMYQMVLAAIPALIVSGAMAERTRFLDFLLFSLVLGGVIYPITGYWLKGEGWLAQMGFRDFGGSTLIHGVGGWSALVGVALLGPRQGRYLKAKAQKIPGLSLIWAGVGSLMITLGGICLNAGATLKITDDIGAIALKTYLAAVVSGLVATLITCLRGQKAEFNRLLSGLIGGVVAIAAGAQEVSIVGAILIGAVAGSLTVYAVGIMERLHLDDPTESISIHLFCGIWGTLALGFLSLKDGLIAGEVRLVIVALIGIISVGLFVIITSSITWLTLKWALGLRLSLVKEIKGLDQEVHGLQAESNQEQGKEK